MSTERLYRPIPTEYNGYSFRSRAEARWAIFFDACRLKYQYEVEGFVLSDGQLYLPDFYLPEISTYFECKGVMTDVDWHKIEQLQKDTGMPIVVGYSDWHFQASDNFTTKGGAFTLADEESSLFVKCKQCGQFYFIGRNGSYNCLHCGFYDGPRTFDVVAKGSTGGRLADGLPEGIVYRSPFDVAKQARWSRGYIPLKV